LDAYSKWISGTYLDVEKRMTPWGQAQVRQVTFIRSNLPDSPLSEMDTRRVEELLNILRLRPNAKHGQPASVSWTRNCLKQLRHFLRWLNKSPEFAWKWPAELNLDPVRIPLAPQEKSAMARSAQVQTYNFDELGVLWEYATAFQRLLMLLALNCGFGRAEVSSLEMSEVLLHEVHPHELEAGIQSSAVDSWVFRLRHKTGVYGEWKLWSETVNGIEWWLRQRAAIAVPSEVRALLTNQAGKRYDGLTKGNNPNFQIPNSWFHLSERIRKDDPSFRRLSFNKLRKTAANLVRSVAGGEVAAVFLCHGAALKRDEITGSLYESTLR
jgi:hypothetical protein